MTERMNRTNVKWKSLWTHRSQSSTLIACIHNSFHESCPKSVLIFTSVAVPFNDQTHCSHKSFFSQPLIHLSAALSLFSAFLWKTSETRQTETNSINHHVLKRIYKRMEYEKEKRSFQIFHSVKKKTFSNNNNVKFYYSAQINCENVVIYGMNISKS